MSEPKPLTVGDLRKLLEQYPDVMPVSYRSHSEWTPMLADDIGTGELFDNGGYCSRPYQAKDGARVTTHLLFPGN